MLGAILAGEKRRGSPSVIEDILPSRRIGIVPIGGARAPPEDRSDVAAGQIKYRRRMFRRDNEYELPAKNHRGERSRSVRFPAAECIFVCSVFLRSTVIIAVIRRITSNMDSRDPRTRCETRFVPLFYFSLPSAVFVRSPLVK